MTDSEAPAGRALLVPGVTCWRTAVAPRFALLPDGASYLPAMYTAIENARRTILLAGWDFDPTVPLDPLADHAHEGARIGDVLRRLLVRRPDLRVDVLIWDMTFVFAMQRRNRPQTAARWLPPQVRYRLDGNHPPGASHHQKVLVVDDAVAFCGGADFSRNRWDTSEHRSRDPRRRRLDGVVYGPRHEVMAMVDGAAAVALGDFVRARWQAACGEPPPPVAADADPWPQDVAPDLRDVTVGISRTLAPWRGKSAAREVEALLLRAVAGARRWIYLENQYVTAPALREALARRLAEPDGPEVLIVCPVHSGGRADRLSMDRARKDLVHRLRAADVHGRFRAMAPVTAEGEPIMVHSKVMVVDDLLFRVGSANLNNRSLGLDTECDLSVEVPGADATARDGIIRLLARLLGEHAGCDAGRLAAELRAGGRLLAALDRVADATGKRLQPVDTGSLGMLDRLVARIHLFDPTGVGDNWRPWRRPA